VSVLNAFSRLLLTCLVTAVMATQAWAEIVVEKAYTRAMPPGQTTGAAFLTLTNTGDKAVVLKEVVTEASKSAELHTHTMDGDIMRMRHLETLTIEPRATVRFQPGGHHIMLFGVKKTLREGDSLTLCLLFDNGEKVDVNVTVQGWQR